jgi:hypothetical protein
MRLAPVLATLIVASLSGTARAAEPTADELIAHGLELRRHSRAREALELFQRAYALAPSARTLGQMGLVEASLERWLDADAHLNASLAAPGDAWVRRNRGFLHQALAVSRGHIGELVVTGPDGTNVSVDRKHAGALPFLEPVRLAEGSAVVTATGVGFKEFSKTVTIAGGAKTSLAIVLDPIGTRPALAVAAPAPLPPPPSPPAVSFDDEPTGSWKTPVGAGLIAAGAGLAAWGIVWVAVDGADHCATAGPSCNTVYGTRTTGWILTAGGAAAAGAGAALMLLGHREGSANVALDFTATSFSLRGRF